MSGYCALPFDTDIETIKLMLINSDKKIQYILCNDNIYSLKTDETLKIEKRGNAEIYTSIVDADLVLENIKNLMRKSEITKNLLEKIQFYQSLFPGTRLKIIHENDKIKTSEKLPFVFAISNKNKDYFDLVVYIVRNSEIIKCITYSDKCYDKVSHSGDIVISDLLLHTIHGIEEMKDVQIYICAVGYNKVQLKKFINKTPSVSIIKYNSIGEPEKMLLIPCPLEEAIIGNNNFATICMYCNGQLFVPFTLHAGINVNVGHTDMYVLNLLMKTYDDCITLNLESDIFEDLSSTSEIMPEIMPEIISKVVKIPKNKILIATEHKELPFNMSTLDINLDLIKLDIDRTPFTSEIYGPVSVLSSKCHKLKFKDLENCKLAFVYINPNNWITSIRVWTYKYLINCICILHLSKIDIDSRDERINLMKCTLNNFLSMIGPKSIIVCEIGSKIYWYDGQRLSGLIDILPNFGDDITNKFKNIYEWSLEQPDDICCWQEIPKSINKETVIQLFLDYVNLYDSLEEIEESETSINNIRFSHNIPKQLSDDLIKIENSIFELFFEIRISSSDNSINSLRKYLIDYMSKLIDDKYKIEISLNQNKNLRKIKIISNKLASFIEKLYSQKNSSSIGHSLKSIQRSSTTKDNIENALKMSQSDWQSFLEESTEQFGCLCISLKQSFLPKLVESNSPILDNRDICIPERTPHIDGLTASSLIEIKDQKIPMIDNMLIISESYENSTVLLIPIFDDAKQHYFHKIHFSIIFNEYRFAAFRIKLRGMITSIKFNRKQPFNGNPSSCDLTIFIINMYFSIIEKLCSNFSKDVVIDQSDALPTLIRGVLFHLFTTMAAGKDKPFTEIYKICYDHSIGSFNNFKFPFYQWEWIFKIIKIFECIQHPVEHIYNNIRKLFCHSITHMFLPITQKAIQENKESKIIDIRKTLIEITEQLQWLKLVAFIFIKIKELQIVINVDYVKRMLEFAPESTSDNGFTYIVKQFNIYLDGKKNPTTKETTELNTRDILEYLSNITTKRSGCMKKLKEKAIDTTMEFEQFQIKQNKIIEEIANNFNVSKDTLKIQNKKLNDKSTFYKKSLNGDAELKRIPWALTDEGKIEQDEIITRTSYILEIELDSKILKSISIQESSMSVSISKSIKKEESPDEKFITELIKVCAKDHIINFVKELNKFTDPYEKLALVQSLNIEKYTRKLFDSICQVLKITNIEEFIIFAIKTTLINFNDNNKSVDVIMKYIIENN